MISLPQPIIKVNNVNHMINLQAMYIRVKRNKTTYFLQCLPSETILQLKEKLHELIDHAVMDQRLILIPDMEVLDDSKSLADQKVSFLYVQ